MKGLEALFKQAARSDEELQRKILEKGDLQLLDLACGACHEANTLARVFGSSERERLAIIEICSSSDSMSEPAR